METSTAATTRKFKPPQEATLEVEEFDAHGTSRAEFGGRTIEVEHGIPGETVETLIYGRRRRWAKLVDIVTPSPDRVEAPCPHFHQGCGGCPWQMLSIQSQLTRKIRRVQGHVASVGLSLGPEDLVKLDEPWRYRITAGLSLGRHAGFRRRGTQSIVAVEDCLISHPLIGRLACYLNQALESELIPDFYGKVGIEVRVVGDNEPRLHLCVTPSPASRHASIEAVLPLALHLAKFDRISGIVYRHRQDLPELLYGEPFGTIHVMGRPFAVSAATFFQTNMILLPELLTRFLAAVSPAPTDTVVDVYGGVGIFGLLLAPSVNRVIEVEIDPVGIEAARQSAQAQDLRNVEFIAGTAESALAHVGSADTVIVDPPRAGLTPKVIEAILSISPSRILYVSCSDQSLARDVAAFQEQGYVAGDLTVFDFYPQTHHVELFTILQR